MKGISIVLFAMLFVNAAFGQDGMITLDQIWKEGTYRSKSVSGIRSMNDGVHYTSLVRTNESLSIIKYSYKSGNSIDTILSSSQLSYNGEQLKFSDYNFNADESKVLLAQNRERIYRRSSKANYFAIDLETLKIDPITDFSKGKQQLAEFSPTENKVAFVRDNNIFINDLDKKEETQITFDGEWGAIINGAVDWVYEEEFSFHKGYHWSPQGTKIAFYRFNESDVPEFDLTYYNGLYPTLYNFKYPKAGEKNSDVEIWIYNLESTKSTEVNLGSEQDQYIPRIKWTKSDEGLGIMRMNRLQNQLEILLAETNKEKNEIIEPSIIYTELSETYIDVNDNLIFLDDGDHFIFNSEKDGWNHIYVFNLDGEEVAQLTKGEWEVSTFYGVNQTNNEIFFSAAKENSISEEIYSVDYLSSLKKYRKTKETVYASDKDKNIKSLTPNGNSNTAVFSHSFDYLINFESSSDQPYDITIRNSNGKLIRSLENNEALNTTISQLNISGKEFGTFMNSENVELNYWIIKPKDFDPSKNYPVMFMVYGGPGKNTVTNSWDGSNYFWHQMLAQQGYIIVSVDPRGTMKKGRDFKHSTYLELGKKETEDLIDAAKYFGKLDFIDSSRIGIMGWSYGGYMSSLCLTKGAEFFKLGIAVAPVTNWRYYDSIYTERFMRTPQENADGYDLNSPINFVDEMKGSYLLVHGSADDNVHYQNTMEMIEALVEADKQFDLFIYPNKNHGIYGGNTRFHLYTKMTNFIKENL